MIRQSLVVLAIITSLTTLGQPWLKNLPGGKSEKELTLFDHKKAFDEYWTPYNVDNKGYYIENGEKIKAAGWKQFNRWYHNMESQVDPITGAFPEKTAQQALDVYLKKNPQSKSALNDSWTGFGPNSSAGGYAGVGRINCIAFHPSDNDTYWVGAPAGGLWKTTDNGSSWSCLTDNNDVLGVSDIIIPSDYATSNTIYIATGDRDAFDNNSIGVLKSTDGGLTWNTTDLSYFLWQNAMVYRLLLDPNDDNTILASTSFGVYKTTNGGADWNTQLSSVAFIDMEYKPGDFSTLYGSTTNGSIYVTADAGANWNENYNDANARRIELAVTADNSAVVYAIAAASDAGLYGIYKSTNSGTSFTQTYSGTTSNLMGWSSDGSDSGGQGWYDLSIAVSPTNEDVVLVGGVITHKSTTGGTSWNCSNCWTSYSGYNTGGYPVVHADKHNLTYRADGSLFECNDGGIYISTDDGTSWTDKSNGLVNSQMYKLGVSQNTANEIITGLQDNGTKLYSGGIWNDVKGGDGMECLIDYTDDNIQYGTYVRGQISRTMNHWISATDIEPSAAGNGAWVTPYIISPTNASTIYAGYAEVWKTTNRGDAWTQISSFGTGYTLRSMAIAPSNTNVLYVATLSSIHATTNDGANWTEITGTLPVASANITNIAVKNDDENTLWVTLSNYNQYAVYESTNGGSSWNNISTGLPEIPAYSIVQNKNSLSETHLYVGTELGVYFKKGSADWVPYNSGLPNVKIGEIEIYYGASSVETRLRAATYGRGLWETPIEENVVTTPIVTTAPIANLTENSVTVGGEVINEGQSPVTARGVVWGTNENPTLSDNVETDAAVGLGAFTSGLTGLTVNTTYFVRAYASNNEGTSYGSQQVFSTTKDVNVIEVYTLGKLPVDFGVPHTIYTLLENTGDVDITDLDVTLTITGDNAFTNVQTLASLPAGALDTVYFDGYSPTIIGSQSLSITVPADANNANNEVTKSIETTLNSYSYAQGEIRDGAVGFTNGTGDFVAKFEAKSAGSLNQVDVEFASDGNEFQIGIWDATGLNNFPGINLYTSPTHTSVSGNYTVLIDPPLELPVGDFYVGVKDISNNNVGFAYQNEYNMRAGVFYFTSPTGNTSWIDFAPNNPFRFMIEPKFAIANDVGLLSASAGMAIKDLPVDIDFELVNYGTAAQTDIEVYYTVNGGSPVGPVTVATLSGLNETATGVFSGAFAFTPADYGNYSITVYSQLPGDAVTDNDAYTFTVSVLAPELFVSASLTDFGTFNVGDVSASQNYSVSGSNLASDVVITAPDGFEISLDDIDFSVNPISISPVNYTVNSTVYVRFVPTVNQLYSSNISHTTAYVTEQLVAVSGDGTGAPVISVTPLSLLAAVTNCNGTDTKTLTIENIGAKDLEVTFPLNVADNFYSYIDSDVAGGPTYDWFDISGIGTNTGLSGDDSYVSVVLPFDFEFYGEVKTNVKISTNGFLSFGSNGTSYGNTELPNIGDPNDFIAVFWDDLNGVGENYTYHDEANNRFVIQYNNWPGLGSGLTYDFQVMLYQSGEILMQYHTLNGDVTSATVGVENVDGSEALQIAYNEGYLHNEMAVLISKTSTWIQYPTEIVTVASGTSTDVDIVFDAATLASGTYVHEVTLFSNDSQNPIINIPATFNVSGSPELELSDASIDFGDVVINATESYEISITNSGCSNLTGIEFVSGDASFITGAFPSSLAEGETKLLEISFSPTAYQNYDANITISSNELTSQVISVSGRGAGSPAINVEPLAVQVELGQDESIAVSLNIENTGLSALEWEEFQHSFTKSDYADWTAEENQWRVADDVWLTRQNEKGLFNFYDETEYIKYSSPSGTKWSYNAPSRSMPSEYTNYMDWSPYYRLNDRCGLYIESEDKYYDVIFTSWTNGGNGGGLSLETLMPDWLHTNYSQGVVNVGESQELTLSIGSFNVLAGLHKYDLTLVTNDVNNPVVEIPIELTVTGDPDIEVPVIIDAGQVIVGKSQHFYFELSNYGIDVLEVFDVTFDNDAFTTSNTSFIVNPTGDVYKSAYFAPTEIGEYSATITITSNDPDESVVQYTIIGEGIPVPEADKTIYVDYTATPPVIDGQIDAMWASVPENTIDVPFFSETVSFDSDATFKTLWDNDSIYVLVSVPDDNFYPHYDAGVNSWQADKIELYFDVNETKVDGQGPWNFGNGHHQFAPAFNESPTTFNFQYVIDGNDANYIAEYAIPFTQLIDEDGVQLDPTTRQVIGFDITLIDLDEIGYGANQFMGRINWVNDVSDGESWNNLDNSGDYVFVSGEPEIDALTSFDFGNIIEGTSTVQTITIQNTGNHVLEITDIVSDASEFVPQATAININPGGEFDLDIEFTAALAQSYSGTLTIVNNDSDESSFAIGLSGAGIAEPSLTLSTSSIDFGNVATNQTSELSFTISGSNLQSDVVLEAPAGFTLSETSGSGHMSSLTFSPTAGSLASTMVYILFSPDEIKDYSDNLTITTGLLNDVLINLTAQGVEPPVIIASETSVDFGGVLISSTAEASFNVSGNGLTDDITVLAPANFQVSLSSGSGFGGSVIVPQGTSALVYVKFAPVANQVYSGNIVLSSAGAANVNVAVQGTGVEAVISGVSTLKANGFYNEGEVIQFDVQYSSAIDIDVSGGAPFIKLNTTPEANAIYLGATQSGITSIPFTYTVGANENSPELDYSSINDLELNGATIQYSGSNVGTELPAVGTFTASHSIVIDNEQPTVVLSASAIATNSTPIQVTVEFSEEVAGFDIADFTLSNASANNLQTVVAGTLFTFDLTASASGEYTVQLPANSAADLAGNVNAESNTLSLMHDEVLPTVVITSNITSPTNQTLVELSFTFSEEVVDFTKDDISLSGASIINLNGSGTDYTSYISVNTNGTVAVDLLADMVTDLAGNGNEAANQYSFEFDGTAPVATVSTLELSPTNANSFVANIQFNEAVSDFTIDDFVVSNANLSAFTVITAGDEYSVTVMPTANGKVSLYVAASAVSDLAGNSNSASNILEVDYDIEAPDVVVSSSVTGPTYSSPIPVNIDFNENVTGFEASDINVVNGVVSELLGSGKAYIANITPSGYGLVTINVSGNTVIDAVGIGNNASNSFSIQYGDKVPEVTISSAENSFTNSSPFVVNIKFSQAVTGFELSDIIASNAALSSFTEVVTGKEWTIEVTPGADGEITIDVPAGVAVNGIQGNNEAVQFVIAYDGTAPTAVLSYGLDYTNASPATIHITFSEEPVGFELSDVSVGNGVASNMQGSGLSYTIDIAPINEGDVTVNIAADQFADVAGNLNSVADQLVFKYDITNPTVVVSSKMDDPTGVSPIVVDVVYSEVVSGFELSDLTIGNGTVANLTGSGQVYTVEVTPTDIGNVTVNLGAGRVIDNAGNGNAAAVQFKIEYVEVTPTVTLTSEESVLTNSSPFELVVEFDQKVTGFELSDLILVNAVASNLQELEEGIKYTVEVSPTTDGNVTVDMNADVVESLSGIGNAAVTQFAITYDGTKPAVLLSTDIVSPTNKLDFTVNVELSETCTGFSEDDITITNGRIGNFTGESFVVTTTGTGEIRISIAAAAMTDEAGNENAASNELVIQVDHLSPTVSISSNENASTNNKAILIDVEFSESIVGFDLSDITTVNASVQNLKTINANDKYSFELVPVADGDVNVSIDSDAVTDSADNLCGGSNNLHFYYDGTAPTVIISTEESNPTNQVNFYLDIDFSEKVEGFTVDDILITNGSLSEFAAIDGGLKYFALVTVANDGEFTAEISPAVATDEFGNDNAASNKLVMHYDGSSPEFISFQASLIESNYAELSLVLSEDGTLFYALVEQNGVEPSIDQVIEKTVANAIVTGSLNHYENKDLTVPLESLTQNTFYTLYAVAVDTIDNKSIVHKYDFETKGVSIKDNTVWGLKLYPNPNSGKFFIEFTDVDALGRELNIISSTGQVLTKLNIEQLKQKVELDNLSQGYYMIVIQGDDGKRTYQFVVE